MRMKIYYSLIALITCTILTASFSASSQSMQVIGGESTARNCYMAATIASQMQIGSREDIEECTFALENVSLRYRDRVATLINRGIIYVAMERYDEAIKDYDRAFRLDPDVAELHVNRGNMFYMGQAYEKAIEEYTSAINMEFTKEHVALYNRGLAYEKIGELEKAEADYRRAIELVPEWGRAQDKLERILRKRNQT